MVPTQRGRIRHRRSTQSPAKSAGGQRWPANPRSNQKRRWRLRRSGGHCFSGCEPGRDAPISYGSSRLPPRAAVPGTLPPSPVCAVSRFAVGLQGGAQQAPRAREGRQRAPIGAPNGVGAGDGVRRHGSSIARWQREPSQVLRRRPMRRQRAALEPCRNVGSGERGRPRRKEGSRS